MDQGGARGSPRGRAGDIAPGRGQDGTARSAGTDDDVYLRVGPGLRFALDKRLYDDFERGDRDTYSVPIDDAVRAGLRVGDIDRVQIEKSRDGVAGGWKLRGVKLASTAARSTSATTSSAGSRTTTAPGARRTSRRAVRAARARRHAGLGEDTRCTAPTTTATSTRSTGETCSLAYTPGAAPGAAHDRGGSTFGGRLDDGDGAGPLHASRR